MHLQIKFEPVEGARDLEIVMSPSFYDPNSDNETPVPLPSSPLVSLAEDLVLQPPLSRRGFGPGLIVFLPLPALIGTVLKIERPLDPEPIQKWAEEGFAVIGITGTSSIPEALAKSVSVLQDLEQVDIKDKFAVAGWSVGLRLNSATITLCHSLRSGCPDGSYRGGC